MHIYLKRTYILNEYILNVINEKYEIHFVKYDKLILYV